MSKIVPLLKADIGDRKDRIFITFEEYSVKLKERMLKMSGSRWVGPSKGGPGFTMAMDMQTCNELRREFDHDIVFSHELMEWGRAEKERERRLKEVAALGETTSDLSKLEGLLEGRTFWNRNENKEMALWDALRPDQKVGVQFINECPNPLIADEAGLGKTWEVICGILQSGTHEGPNLVICPKISIDSVWLEELNMFQDEAVFVAPEGKRQREKLLEEVAMCVEEDVPFWLVLNPAMIGLREADQDGDVDFYDHVTGRNLRVQFPFLFEVHWNNIIIDETHISGLPNPSSQFSRAVRMMTCDKRIAMSGTPMGGKPERLWGTLNWLEPKDFGAKRTWLKRWVKETSFTNADGKVISKFEGLKGTLEEEFYKEHSKYMLRRKKEDVHKDLPPKQFVDIWCDFASAKHRKQYELMEQEAVANIMESEEEIGRISMANVLATNTWLKQFSNAYCELVEREKVWNDFTDGWEIKYRAMPTEVSPKLEALWTLIQEIGADDPGSGEQVVVFTQFRYFADLITDWLRDKKKLKVAKITGSTNKRSERETIIKDFQEGGNYQVIVMTTKAGGVSINLDSANSVIFMDETYDPDDQDQASNRVHRASRIHRVTCYTLRTRHTIEEDIQKKLKKKVRMNDILLDRYRQAKEKAGK